MRGFHWAVVNAFLHSRRRVRRRPVPPNFRKPPKRDGGLALPEPVEPNPNRPRQGGAAAEMEFED